MTDEQKPEHPVDEAASEINYSEPEPDHHASTEKKSAAEIAAFRGEPSHSCFDWVWPMENLSTHRNRATRPG